MCIDGKRFKVLEPLITTQYWLTISEGQHLLFSTLIEMQIVPRLRSSVDPWRVL